MKEMDKRKTPVKNQSKRTPRAERKERRPHQENNNKTVEAKESIPKGSHMKSNSLVSESNTNMKPSDVHQNLVIDHVADANKFEPEKHQDSEANVIAERGNENVVDNKCTALEKDVNHRKEEISDSETMTDSNSSKSDSLTMKEEKVERASNFPENILEDNSSDCSLQNSSEQFDHGVNKSPSEELSCTPKKTSNSDRDPPRVKNKKSSKSNSRSAKIVPKPSSESSEGTDYQIVDEVKDIEVLDEALNGVLSIRNGPDTNGDHDNQAVSEQKIEEMENRIDKLEEELRVVAALEMSLYSVVPEHGSSVHKVHTPARRLSRIYIYACKHWSQDKRATVAKNIVSGLVLIAKSCGSDVPRLTFWLSNTIVMREITSQTFSSLRSSNPLKIFVDANNSSQKNGWKPTAVQWRNSYGNKQVNSYMQSVEDWQETGTFMAALEKVEFWIFSRIVESVWWQSLTPNMQPRDPSRNKIRERLMGPALGDQQQGNYSVNLWRSTFQDAFQRLCPVRASGHECGCLPVLARMVMEQCVSRLDVAMFNAILRESSHEIPTDPVSDPIVDAKVLPIPAGDLSFGSGAQLKNSVGNWSRWLTDMVGIDADDSSVDQHGSDDDIKPDGDGRPHSFPLLNSLSDLLMLPKDMLTDRSIRKEVCPLISLPLITRILCNFTPDEFCPDPVPGTVLESLNAESIGEQRVSGYSGRNFPYIAAPVFYISPSTSDVAEKVAEAGGKSHLERNISTIQRKGYTSDEELEELDSPLLSIVDKSTSTLSLTYNSLGNGGTTLNMRYKLLQEVWSV
ncbi:Nucleolar protein gar2-related isoform 1 [Cucumis melo var. makuwa]|uniref:Nucleolar protein gar2-related isoform 1 n=1 Tax=Cucumis melo var. makuwa TaxID=1194695 RepID=A0A5D3E250_CUCMM|nr:Nucleolar protein gar2-related isoform 1 [Cucumis melo var. makuwa]